MKLAFLLAVLAGASAPLAVADEAPPRPPLPAPSVPPPARLRTAARERPTSTDDKPKTKKLASPSIQLGEKRETDNPDWQGAGIIQPARIGVKAEGGKLTAVLAGAADSHSFFGVTSVTVATIRLEQEFDIVPADPAEPQVRLSLSGKIDGNLRSGKTGAASLRQADAAVYPACGGPPIWLAFPPASAPLRSEEQYQQETQSPPLIVPAGRYVLVMNLVLETTVKGCLRDGAEAVFVTGKGEGSSESGAKFLGFEVILVTAAPPLERSGGDEGHPVPAPLD